MNAVTIVGTEYYFGIQVFKVGQILHCIKDPENNYDMEAIKVVSDVDVQYGHIANSIHTVAKGCKSGGRIYDTFEKRLKIQVQYIIGNAVIALIICDDK